MLTNLILLYKKRIDMYNSRALCLGLIRKSKTFISLNLNTKVLLSKKILLFKIQRIYNALNNSTGKVLK